MFNFDTCDAADLENSCDELAFYYHYSKIPQTRTIDLRLLFSDTKGTYVNNNGSTIAHCQAMRTYEVIDPKPEELESMEITESYGMPYRLDTVLKTDSDLGPEDIYVYI